MLTLALLSAFLAYPLTGASYDPRQGPSGAPATAPDVFLALADFTECLNGRCRTVNTVPFANQFDQYPPAGSIIVLPGQNVASSTRSTVTATRTTVAAPAPAVSVSVRRTAYYGGGRKLFNRHPLRRLFNRVRG